MTVDFTFLHPHDPITEADLIAFEQEHNLTLPEDYRQFLLDYNGGELPTPGKFQAQIYDKDSMTEIGIEVFCGIKSVPPYAQLSTKALQQRGIDGFLGIASMGKYPYLMSLRDQDYGCIYFWDSDYYFRLGDTDEKTVYRVAESFTALINKMY